MKQINGIPHNITESIIGVISTKSVNIFRRKNTILVAPTAKDNGFGYLATITALNDISPKGCVVSRVQDCSDFSDGDVVLINQKGEIVFQYEINSNHNAIFATGKCNHRCIMCPQPPVIEEPDYFELNSKIISLCSKKTKEIGITGGEPTLVGDQLFDYIRQIQKRMPEAALNILSNGVKFADKTFAAKLAACKCKDLQIDIPIFSDIPSIHNKVVGANTFYKTVQGLYNLALYRQRIGIRIVVHKLTYERLPQLSEYVYRNFPFVSQVAFLQMETIGLAEGNISELWIDPYDYNSQLTKAVEILDNRGIKPLIYNSQLCILPEQLRRFAANAISDWKDTFLPECTSCQLRDCCGGLFASNQNFHSSHIKRFN
ncbi:MAG: His-Xaa-Ser system radical SAM maturase HxsC [Duncaniella sp.]|uniref:His-Xaa-Ser system radical SAM maturase HxsC n=1 Tax=Duncaniella sp. TaxID=2518496 RepID=UPI0023D49504|nr:His-Xaa-Ser system radical SAM maturase HxsC [Duncaniella sp.]MDE5988560.1 His-Xaa-Ser system radical SAM maturase HxsC [Duncaniella sp.]